MAKPAAARNPEGRCGGPAYQKSIGKPKAEICAKVSLQVTYVGRTNTFAYVITVTPMTATAQKINRCGL
jgi:hypothetical protein